MRGFALAMSAVYIAVGALLLFTDVALDLIPRFRPGLAVVLITYGVLRAWKVLRKGPHPPAA
jgi:hypothetical protein